MSEKAEARVDPRDVGRMLGAATAVLRSELTALPPAALAWHPAPGEWCTKDVLAISSRPSAAASPGGSGSSSSTTNPWDADAVSRERRDCERDVSGLLE